MTVKIICDVCGDEADDLDGYINIGEWLGVCDEWAEQYRHVCRGCHDDLKEIFAVAVDEFSEMRRGNKGAKEDYIDSIVKECKKVTDETASDS